MRCSENCNTYSQNWSTERAQFSTMPKHTSHIKASKVEQIRLRSFASSTILTWPLTNYHFFNILTAFCGKMLPQPEVVRKYFPRVPLILKHRFLCYRNKLPLIFLFGKNVLNVMVPILINKDVFEPSYDWKFTVQNWNYFFTNLINEYINARNRQITHAEQFHTTYVDSQSLRR